MNGDGCRWRTLLLLLGLAGCATTGPDPGLAASAQDAPARAQILVMLPIAPAHFRPGADYGAGYDELGGREARRRIAADLASTHELELVADWPMPSLGVDCFLMRLPDGRPVGPFLDALSRDRRVAWAQAVSTYRALGRGDSLYSLQPSAGAWQLAQIHQLATGRNVAVAELDSGVELTHPNLLGQISLAENFVDASAYLAESHGTAVAGIIAARADNGTGIVGVAPAARLLALRACWQAGPEATLCNSFTLAKALQFALRNGAQVINMSLTGPKDRLLQLLLDAAQARGIAVVGAVDPLTADGGFPASYPGVIAVAADDSGAKSDTVLAPGEDVPTTLPGAAWGFVSGSSFAAAHVSGLLALLRELAPSMAPSEARELLVSASAAPAAELPSDRQYGAQTRVCAVIARAARACPCVCEQNATAKAISRR